MRVTNAGKSKSISFKSTEVFKVEQEEDHPQIFGDADIREQCLRKERPAKVGKVAIERYFGSTHFQGLFHSWTGISPFCVASKDCVEKHARGCRCSQEFYKFGERAEKDQELGCGSKQWKTVKLEYLSTSNPAQAASALQAATCSFIT